MELRRPILQDKQDFLDMQAEFERFGSRASGNIYAWQKADGNFERWLDLLHQQETRDVLESGLGPFVLYLSYEGNRLLGLLALRTTNTPAVLGEYGHIGYCIRPSERGKGYAKEQLCLGLIEAKAKAISRVLLTCHVDNEASRRTILSQGGQLENQVDGTERYWIELEEA
ncbi:GNAT family N-acetyltransferase [Streptococcus marmotae]|uniref:GNAT family N-acetyltransferase n=1 Tax=Streptococcus marmotae TaxID=1825069 RepID=UPI00082C3784|nr:GNAT family N-acetyltransferase [Streptococcus marmotae]